jgi:uncharacterized protein (TIGR02646 family)
MRAITKGPEPASLTEHRAQRHSDYANYQGKDDLRQALVREQRGLCCYCMGPIRNDAGSMKIEHWKSQAYFPSEQLIYRNLLGGCLGGEGQPVARQWCDTKKGDLELKWNPAEPTHPIEARIQYAPDGAICSDDPEFDDQLNRVLNLNIQLLKNSRRGVLDGLLEWWHKKKPVPKEQIARKIERQIGGHGQLQPYCQVAVWWLQHRLAGMA